MKNLVLLFVTVFFYQCGSSKEEEIPDGGACIYDTTIIPATLVEFDHDSLHSHLRFAYTLHGGDTIFDQMEVQELEKTYHINDTTIHTGEVFQFWEIYLTSGSCAGYHQFTFNRYAD